MIHIYFGKDNRKNHIQLRKAIERGLKPIIPYTTLPFQEGDVDNMDYHFVTPETFKELIDSGKLVTYHTYEAIVDGEKKTLLYGAPKVDPDNGDYACILDLIGIEEFIVTYGKEKLMLFYVNMTPDRNALSAQQDTSELARIERSLFEEPDIFGLPALQYFQNKYQISPQVIKY